MYLFFAGFRGSYRPPALPNHGLEDNRPDVHHEADFDIPDTQAVLERFMSNYLPNMSKLADVEYQALSDLLDSLPDHSSYTTAKTMTAAAARENGVIPEDITFCPQLCIKSDAHAVLGLIAEKSTQQKTCKSQQNGFDSLTVLELEHQVQHLSSDVLLALCTTEPARMTI